MSACQTGSLKGGNINVAAEKLVLLRTVGKVMALTVRIFIVLRAAG